MENLNSRIDAGLYELNRISSENQYAAMVASYIGRVLLAMKSPEKPDIQPFICKLCNTKPAQSDRGVLSVCDDCWDKEISLMGIRNPVYESENPEPKECSCDIPEVDHNDPRKFQGSECTKCGYKINIYRNSSPELKQGYVPEELK